MHCYVQTECVPQEIAALFYNDVVSQKKSSIGEIRRTDSLSKEAKMLAEFIDNETSCFHSLSDRLLGITAIDFALPNNIAPKEQILTAASLFDCMNHIFFCPQTEPINSLNFTLYKSSIEQSKTLNDEGLRYYEPSDKIGFHNDMSYDGSRYFLPRFVSLMNLFVGYKTPGSFYFVNQNEWDDFDFFCGLFQGRRYRFRPTPIIYETRLTNLPGLENWTRVPMVWTDGNGQPHAFCNGELIDDEGSDVEHLQSSLMGNPKRHCVQQKTFRMIIFRNDLGFHSRDIFQDQFVYAGVTRLMLRGVSRECVELECS